MIRLLSEEMSSCRRTEESVAAISTGEKGLAPYAQPSALAVKRDSPWETNPLHVPRLAPQMVDRALFQQKFVEDKTRKVISMDLNRMLLKMKPKHGHDTEQTLNHKWIFGCAPKAMVSSLQAGLGDHHRSYLDQNKLNMVTVLILFYADQEDFDKVCAVYEKDVASLADAMRRLVFVDPRLERSLMDAAI